MTDILNNELYQYDIAEAEYRGEERGEEKERNRLLELQGILIKTNQQDVALRLHSMSDDEIKSLYRKYGLEA